MFCKLNVRRKSTVTSPLSSDNRKIVVRYFVNLARVVRMYSSSIPRKKVKDMTRSTLITRCFVQWVFWRRGVVVSGVRRMNEVNPRLARLVCWDG